MVSKSPCLQFEALLFAVRYTYAEESHDGLPAGSFVFSPQAGEEHPINSWWTFVPGADWRHPQGPMQQDSFDPYEPGVTKRVQRGGSFLCSDRYCSRYRLGSRGKGEPSSAALHVGFRCVRSDD